MSIPVVFWAAAACKELAFIWIGFPSGLITVTVFPKVNLMNIHSVSNHNMAIIDNPGYIYEKLNYKDN